MRVLVLSLIAYLVAGPVPASPQEAAPKKTILAGTIVGPDGQPIAGAEVFVGDVRTPLVTNGQGRFRLLEAPARPIWVSARSIGYSPTRRSLKLQHGETRDIRLVLEPLPVRLPDIEVRERSGFGSRRLADVWPRFRAGWGRFLTRDDIERWQPPFLSQLVRPYFPFADWVADRFFMPDPRGGAFLDRRRCTPAVSVNGHVPWEGMRLDDIPMSSVEAVEVYRPRLSEVPIEFSYLARPSSCGLVVVWLR